MNVVFEHRVWIDIQYMKYFSNLDADVLVIIPCSLPRLYQGLKLWLEFGLTSNNTLRYINVNKICQSLGYKLTWLSCFHWERFYCIV